MAEQDMEKYFDLIKNLGQTHISMIQFYKKPAGSETPSDLTDLELLDEF